MSSIPAPVTAERVEAARLLLSRKAAHEADRNSKELRESYFASIRLYREIRGPQPGDRVSVGEGLPKTWGRPLGDVISRGEKTALVRLCGFDHVEKRVPVAGLDVGAMELLVAAHDDVETELELDAADHAALDELVGSPIVGLPVAVIPCSSRKLDHRAPAVELYVGSYFRAALAAARALVDGDDSRIRILSGLHGFLPLDFPVNPYEQRIDAPGAISDAELEAEVAADPVLRDASKVIVLAGRAYAERAARALPRHEWPMVLASARGIGDHLRYFAALARDDEAPDLDDAIFAAERYGEPIPGSSTPTQEETPTVNHEITPDEIAELEIESGFAAEIDRRLRPRRPARDCCRADPEGPRRALPMGPLVIRLSRSQDEALEIALERDPEVVWTSNRNGASYVAAGSASKLVELGLAEYPPEHRLRFDRIVLTDAGRIEARARRSARALRRLP